MHSLQLQSSEARLGSPACWGAARCPAHISHQLPTHSPVNRLPPEHYLIQDTTDLWLNTYTQKGNHFNPLLMPIHTRDAFCSAAAG